MRQKSKKEANKHKETQIACKLLQEVPQDENSPFRKNFLSLLQQKIVHPGGPPEGVVLKIGKKSSKNWEIAWGKKMKTNHKKPAKKPQLLTKSKNAKNPQKQRLRPTPLL